MAVINIDTTRVINNNLYNDPTDYYYVNEVTDLNVIIE